MPIFKTDRIENDTIQKAYIIGNRAPTLHYYKFKALITAVFGKINCFNSNISVTDEISIKLSKDEYYKFGLLGKKQDGYLVTVKSLDERARMILDKMGEIEFITFQSSNEFKMEKIPVSIQSYSLTEYVIVDLNSEVDLVEWMGMIQIRANRIRKGDRVDPFIAIYEQPEGIDIRLKLFELEGFMDITQFMMFVNNCYCMNIIGEFSQIIYGKNPTIDKSKVCSLGEFFENLKMRLSLLFTVVLADMFLDSKIYQGIDYASASSRLLSEDGQVGASAQGKDTGILIQIQSNDDLQNFVDNSLNQKYAIVLPLSLFPTALPKLQSTGKVAGLILIQDSATSLSFGLQSPNLKYSLNPKSTYTWNPNGNGLAYFNYDFPVFEIQQGSIPNSLNDALLYNKNSGNSFPLYSMEFAGQAWSVGKSSICLKRGFCQPIGELSVWSSFNPNIASTDKKPIILISSRFDSNALVRDLSFGTAIKASPVVLMGIADALSKANIPALPKNLVFTFFGAETWGFAGSQRFVKDISTPFVCLDNSKQATSGCPYVNGDCVQPCQAKIDFTKINFDSIESIIEFDTVGLLNSDISKSTNIYMHVNEVNDQTTKLVQTFTSTSVGQGFNQTEQLNLTISSAGATALPPSSAMSFLSRKKIPALLLADYDSQYSNPFFESELDLPNWNDKHITHLCQLVNVTASKIYSLASGTSAPPQVVANCTLIYQMLDCVTRNYSCPLMQSVYNSGANTDVESSYSGVFNFGRGASRQATFIHNMMTNITAQNVKGNCTKISDCSGNQICFLGNCLEAMTRYHDAYGAGLEFNYHSNQYEVVSTANGTWTETTWDTTQIRVFKIISPTVQIIQLVVGILLTVLTEYKKIKTIYKALGMQSRDAHEQTMEKVNKNCLRVMEQIDPQSKILILNSLYYLADTEINVKSRYGEDAVIYNHKTGLKCSTDSRGMAILEGGGIYSVQNMDSELAKNAGYTPERKIEQDKSFFKTLISSNKYGYERRRSSSIAAKLGLPTMPNKKRNSVSAKSFNSLVEQPEATQEDSTPFIFKKKSRNPSLGDIKADPMRMSKPTFPPPMENEEAGNSQKEMGLIDMLKSTPAPKCEIKVRAPSSANVEEPIIKLAKASSVSVLSTSSKVEMEEKEDGSMDMLDILSSAPTKSPQPSPKPMKVAISKSPSFSLASMKKRVSTDATPTKISIDDQLKTWVDNELHDCVVRIDDSILLVIEPMTGDIITEMGLKNSFSKPLKNTNDFDFIVKNNDSEIKLQAMTYKKMIELIAMFNSVSAVVSEGFGSNIKLNDFDMHFEIFDREYRILMDNFDRLPYFSSKIDDSLVDENVPPALFRINSIADGIDNIQYLKDGNGKMISPFEISSVKLDKLVERMTDIYGPNENFIWMVLQCYRGFIDGVTLLRKFQGRLHPVLPPNDENHQWKPVIKLRTIAVVFTWVNKIYSPDFVRDDMKTQVNFFAKAITDSFGSSKADQELDSKYKVQFSQLQQTLMCLIQQKGLNPRASKLSSDRRTSMLSTVSSNDKKRLSLQTTSSFNTEKPAVISPTDKKKEIPFLDLDCDDLANALMLKEKEMLQSVTPLSLVLHTWESQKETIIQEEISCVNDIISYWVATEICTQPEMKNRVKVMEKIIKLAGKCHKMNNFNSLIAIVSGLNLVSVSRLKASWENVEQKRMKQLQMLEDLTTPVGNYKVLRAAIEELDTGKTYIPVLSLLLKDLFFMNEGNNTFLNATPDMEKAERTINLEKITLIYTHIVNFTNLASSPLSIKRDTSGMQLAEEYCSNLRALKEAPLYKYSCLCEAKSGDDQLRLRDKWMTK
ncbi:hypothetical protein HDV06_006851 [Boothiomyces sp. JEL0866]|nr:hypothetical protein HDV06_006851 [Boothiomyces sp. JEL0866]